LSSTRPGPQRWTTCYELQGGVKRNQTASWGKGRGRNAHRNSCGGTPVPFLAHRAQLPWTILSHSCQLCKRCCWDFGDESCWGTRIWLLQHTDGTRGTPCHLRPGHLDPRSERRRIWLAILSSCQGVGICCRPGEEAGLSPSSLVSALPAPPSARYRAGAGGLRFTPNHTPKSRRPVR